MFDCLAFKPVCRELAIHVCMFFDGGWKCESQGIQVQTMRGEEQASP
jgi:hypothetical protein